MKSLPKVSHSPSRVEKRKQPKSRNGCLACKQKRMKCDETKPACLRCLSKKAECPGYGVQPLVWSTRHEKTLLPESNFVDKDNQTLENLISNAQKAITGREELVSPKSTAETIVSESVENGVPSEVDRISPSPAEDEPISPYSPESSPRSEPKRLKSSISIVGERLQKSTVPEFMVHLPTELVHHYFSQVCQIFSSFDGSLNPFRSTISKLFQSSAPIYYAIQSMAAAYLANHFPRMALVGIQMQHEAYKSLHQSQFISTPGSEDLDKVLLSILLIGQTTAWHNPSDLGLRHLNTAKRLNGRRYQVQQTTSNPQVRRQNQFFDQCLLYWEMVASYVADRDDVELTDQPGDGVFEVDVANENRTSIFPHPWTGVSADVQRMFCQVGRLIRRFRKSMTRPTTVDFFVLDMGIDMNSSELVEINLQAKALEENLLSIELPSVSSIVDAGDDNTPAHHYILLAESYKCAALLQIYRIFPFILHQRFPVADLGTSVDPRNRTHEFFDNFQPSTYSCPSEWLVSFAIHILSLLQKMPITSGTRCLQPLVFVTAAAELRFPDTSPSPFSVPATFQLVTSSIVGGISEREIEVAQMREFVMTRLQEFKQHLPSKPILKAEQLIQVTWARSDTGQDVYWMDVMRDLGCETILG